jgi:heterodisulfide reductase subunit D
MGEAAEELKRHNVQQIEAKGARGIVFTCPSCYRMWWREYRSLAPHLELLHSTQFLKRLVEEGKIKLGEIKGKVTYHDPCDLGRNSRVFEAPRQVIQAVPGLTLVEVEQNREKAYCCGGGGDLEISDPQLAAAMAGRTLEALLRTGADIVVTACQQCKRTLLKVAEEHRAGVEILDVAELVLRAMQRAGDAG